MSSDALIFRIGSMHITECPSMNGRHYVMHLRSASIRVPPCSSTKWSQSMNRRKASERAADVCASERTDDGARFRDKRHVATDDAHAPGLQRTDEMIYCSVTQFTNARFYCRPIRRDDSAHRVFLSGED